MMKAQLSGMPECKFGLNDKLIMEKEGGAASAAAAQTKGGKGYIFEQYFPLLFYSDIQFI